MQKAKRGRAKTYDSDNLMFRSMTGVLVIALGMLTIISIVGGMEGVVFSTIKQEAQGLGGILCLGIPVLLIWGGGLIAFSARRRVPVRAFLLVSLIYLFVLGIINLLSKIGTSELLACLVSYNQGLSPAVADPSGYWNVIKAGYQFSNSYNAFGGSLGMLTAWPLWTYVNAIGGVGILGCLALICMMFVSQFDILGSVRRIRENSNQRMEEREVQLEKKAVLKQLKKEQEAATKKQNKPDASVAQDINEGAVYVNTATAQPKVTQSAILPTVGAGFTNAFQPAPYFAAQNPIPIIGTAGGTRL
jgi:hypothetical protein